MAKLVWTGDIHKDLVENLVRSESPPSPRTRWIFKLGFKERLYERMTWEVYERPIRRFFEHGTEQAGFINFKKSLIFTHMKARRYPLSCSR